MMTREQFMSNLIPCLASDTPYAVGEWLDLKVYLRLVMGECSGVVTPLNLESAGIPTDEALECAKRNLGRQLDIMPLDMIVGMFPPVEGGSNTVILTTKSRMFGAGTVLLDGLLDKVAQVMHTSDLYIIPSSVHEMLVTSHQMDELNDIIRSVNDEVVEERDVLTNHAYHFCNGKVEVVK